MEGFNIEVAETGGGFPLLRVEGEIDLHTCPLLRAALARLMEAGHTRILMDMSEVPYVDSAALGVLVDTQRRLKERSGDLYLGAVSSFVMRAFEITRLIRLFRVFDTVALAGETAAADAATPAG